MAGVRTSLTEAQIESRRNHYLEKIGQGKPKAKGTKSNPLKNEDLARMLKARFGKKGKAKNAGKATGEAIAELNQQTAGTENAASKSKAATEPKTWKKYLNERGKEYTAPKSGVAEADRRAAEIIKKNEEAANVNRQKALSNAKKINKPFVITADEIDKNLGIGEKKYPVSGSYADDYAKLLDEKYGPQGGSKPATSGKIPQAGASAVEAAEKGKAGAKNAVKDGAKKPGFFSKIGNFFKGKTGKFALAAAAVAVVAGLIKCCSGDDKKDNNLVMPTPSVPDKPEVTPQESKYDVCYEEGEMPKSYTIKAGDYPSAIISAMYGVKFGTPEYNAIKEAVYNASEYQPNTNLYAGDKFTLPDVEVNGKVYSANPEAEVTPGTIADNGLKLAHTKEVVKEDDKFYIIYKETGEKVPNEPSFDSEDAARGRILELDEAEKEQK